MSFFNKGVTASLLLETNYNQTLTSAYLEQFASKEILFASLNACCFDIQEQYLLDCVESLFAEPNKNDIVCLMMQDKKTQDIVVAAFMIVELGECLMLPNTFSIKLICSKEGTKGLGGLLIGNYLVNLLARGESIGVLELANSYVNTSGLCLYEKFGFRYNIRYVGTDCYPNYGATEKNKKIGEYDNLPMFVNLNTFVPVGLDGFTYIVGVIKGTEKPVKPEICKILDPLYQQIYAILEEIKRVAIITDHENNKKHKGTVYKKSTVKQNLQMSVSHKYFVDIFNFINNRKADNVDMIAYLTDIQEFVKAKYANVPFSSQIQGRKTNFVSQGDDDVYVEILNYLRLVHCTRSPQDCPVAAAEPENVRPMAKARRTTVKVTGGSRKKRFLVHKKKSRKQKKTKRRLVKKM
jgi:hypothetical protein